MVFVGSYFEASCTDGPLKVAVELVVAAAVVEAADSIQIIPSVAQASWKPLT